MFRHGLHRPIEALRIFLDLVFFNFERPEVCVQLRSNPIGRTEKLFVLADDPATPGTRIWEG